MDGGLFQHTESHTDTHKKTTLTFIHAVTIPLALNESLSVIRGNIVRCQCRTKGEAPSFMCTRKRNSASRLTHTKQSVLKACLNKDMGMLGVPAALTDNVRTDGRRFMSLHLRPRSHHSDWRRCLSLCCFFNITHQPGINCNYTVLYAVQGPLFVYMSRSSFTPCVASPN